MISICHKLNLPLAKTLLLQKFFTKQVGAAELETGIPDGIMGLDAGPKSRVLFDEVVKRSKLIVWNG